MNSLAFLDSIAKAKPQPVYAVHGDESFLKRRVLLALRTLVLGPDEGGFGLSAHAGDKAAWAAVHDDLETLPFLSPRRLVVVENADPFVTRERARLEKYVAEHGKGAAPAGVLVLDLQSLPATTRLAKLLGESGAIVCKTPRSEELLKWCVEWSASHHGKTLAAAAARLLVDLVGPDMGLLDQELAKLATYAGTASRIEAADVDHLVGSSRAENTWEIFDRIGAGRAGDSLVLLNRLLDQGEDPLRLLGRAFSMQLRRLAQAARLNSQGVALGEALDRVGVPPFARRQAEQQMRHLGRRRLDSLYNWLLQTDFGIKGASPLPPRTLLERLVVQLARSRPQ